MQRYIYIFIASQILAKTQEMKGSCYLTNNTDRMVTFLNYSTDFGPRGDVFSCVPFHEVDNLNQIRSKVRHHDEQFILEDQINKSGAGFLP